LLIDIDLYKKTDGKYSERDAAHVEEHGYFQKRPPKLMEAVNLAKEITRKR